MLEGYNITPDAFAGKTAAEIANFGREGKIHVKLGDSSMSPVMQENCRRNRHRHCR